MTYSKTLLAAIVWLMNLAALFIYISTYNTIERYQSKLIMGYSCFFTLAFISFFIYTGFENNVHKGLTILTASSLSIYFLFIILYYQYGIENYKSMMGAFLLTELTTLGCVIISGLKLGLFKK